MWFCWKTRCKWFHNFTISSSQQPPINFHLHKSSLTFVHYHWKEILLHTAPSFGLLLLCIHTISAWWTSTQHHYNTSMYRKSLYLWLLAYQYTHSYQCKNKSSTAIISRMPKMMAKQIQPSKQYDSQQDDYVHNEKWSPDTFFTLASALWRYHIPYHDRRVYSALFNGWTQALLLSFKWPIFQNVKCIFFLTICTILGHVRTVMYYFKRKWT